MHENTVRSIRNRLFLLLLRAFAIVVLIFLLVIMVSTAVVLAYPSRDNPLYRLPTVSRLETYYIARGSWDGVNAVFEDTFDFEARQLRESMLLDAQGQVVLDHGKPVTGTIIYVPKITDPVVSIVVKGVTVGQLVLDPQAVPPQRRITYGFLQPLLLVSGFLALLTILIGLLLTRRVVMPLAEVIAAAKEVANGNLQTRVKVQGPDDLRDLSDSFNQMADALERNDRERRDMLADIAHELRTPLSVLRGRLEGILDGVYTPDEAHIVPALEETYLLERLVEDLRLLTLAESRQLVFEKRSIDLNELAEHVVTLFQAQANENNIALSLKKSEMPAVAFLDPQRTEQVFGNLLNNALRYANEGGKVWMEVEQAGDAISVNVNDNGPGIPDDELPLIFNRFWRGDRSRSRSSGGAGLGLAIARQLVEAQGGKISACNLPGGGLQVRVDVKVSE